MNAKSKTVVELVHRVRVSSGDTSNVSISGGRLVIGSIGMEVEEFPAFVEALKEAVKLASIQKNPA